MNFSPFDAQWLRALALATLLVVSEGFTTHLYAQVTSSGSTATATAVAARKPMVAWFANYEKYFIDDEFIVHSGACIDSRWPPLSFDALSNYSAMLIGWRAGRALSTDENAALEKWVAAGGTLIFSGDEPRRLWENKPPEWVGGKEAGAWWSSAGFVAMIRQPDHPLLRGIPELAPKDGWKEEAGFGFTAGQSLIGDDKVSILYENKHGAGRIIYAGAEFIPSQWPKLTGGSPAGLTRNMTPLMQQFWTNLIAYIGVPTRHEMIAEWAKTRPTSDALAVWFSYDEKPTGGMAHVPPYPAAPADELKEMRVDLGIGDRFRRDFFVTTLRDIPDLVVDATDLKGPSGAVIPSSNVRLYIQEKPQPDYWKASYWLVDPKNVEPLGSPAVKVRANETYTYWIVLESGDATAGDYAGELRLRSSEKLLTSIPLRVKVWPLHAPHRNVLQFEMEHIWFCMPGGYWLDPKTYDANLLAKYQRNLGQIEVNVGESWSDIDKGYYDKFIHLRGDGRLIEQAINESPELFLKDPMPSLDFTGGPHDTWWNNAINAGFTSFSQTWALADVSHGLAVIATKNKDLPIGSPEHLRFLKWFWGEYRKYLNERGVSATYIKIGDEFGADGIPAYLTAAMPMHEAGFKTYTTTYNAIQSSASVMQMDPGTDMWQVGFTMQNPRDLFRQNGVPFDADNEVWGTAASSFWGGWYSGGRGYGILAAKLRMEGVHLHGYMRWQRDEGQGCWAGPDGPCPSAGNTIWGQGISEGRWLAKLYRMIDLAKQTNRGADVAKQIESEIDQQIIGVAKQGSPPPLIPIQPGDESVIGGAKTNVAGLAPGITDANFVAAKRKILEMMVKLRDAMGPIAPSVTYEKTPLVADGHANCIIVSTDTKSAAAACDRIEQLGGVRPKIASQIDLNAKGDGATIVLIGTPKDDPTLPALAKTELSTEITPFCPRAGTYLIKPMPATTARPAMIVIAAGDAAGVEMGVHNFCKLLTAENRW